RLHPRRPHHDALRRHRRHPPVLRRPHPSGGLRPPIDGRRAGPAPTAVSPSLVAVLADLPKPTRPPGQVTGTVHQVLSRPEYSHPGPSFLDRLQNDVLDRI